MACHTLLALALLQCFFNQRTSALFLPGCAHNVSKTPAVCCPIPEGYKTACGFPTRGICRRTQAFKEPVIDKFAYQFKHDVRTHWPHRVFQFSCECIGRFWGQDCGECWYGYEGTNCQHRTMYIRRRGNTMTKEQKKYFVDVMTKAASLPSRELVPTGIPKNGRIQGPWKATNIIENLVFFHWFAGHQFMSENNDLCTKTPLSKRMDFSHGQPNYIMFHRLFSLVWEREMQKVGRKYFNHGNWTWPYFDWTNANKCDVCTDDFAGSETGAFDPVSGGNRLSHKSPFHNWKAYCSNFHRPACSNCYDSNKTDYITRRWMNTRFPRASDVRRVLQVPLLYNLSSMCYSFTHMLDSGQKCFCNPEDVRLHRQVHLMTNGTMIRAAASPSDPFFMLHHMNIDRLFSRWFQRVLPSNFEIPTFHASWLGGCRQCAIVSALPVITNEDMMTDTESLGFIYEDYNFGPVKASEKIASPYNVFVTPKDRGCPKKGKTHKMQTSVKVKPNKKRLDRAEAELLRKLIENSDQELKNEK